MRAANNPASATLARRSEGVNFSLFLPACGLLTVMASKRLPRQTWRTNLNAGLLGAL